nr:hypothetical protein CTI12_AA390800 [Ipomoea batatas]
MDKKRRREVTDVKRDAPFEMGSVVVALKPSVTTPVLLPPGTVIAAANTTVTIRAAAIEHEVAASFIHFSPIFKSLCSSLNTIFGVLSSLFLSDEKYGGVWHSVTWRVEFNIFSNRLIRLGIILGLSGEIEKDILAVASIASCVMDGEKPFVAALIEEIMVVSDKDFSHLGVSELGSNVKCG